MKIKTKISMFDFGVTAIIVGWFAFVAFLAHPASHRRPTREEAAQASAQFDRVVGAIVGKGWLWGKEAR